MSTADERIAVFQDTMDWIENDPDLYASVTKAKKNTTVFYEDDYPVFDASEAKSMTISVSGDRSYQAAMRLHKQRPFAKIAVMNFANAFHAGGGVTKGSSAQEESLCRTSTLYPLLYRRTLRDTFYKHHHDLNTPKASDSLVYTEGVIICKTDEDHPKRMPKEDWVTVDVITIAAPDLRQKSNQHAPLVNGGTYMNDAELFGYHVKRAIHMFTCAASKGADILVLGAFGCGAFENNPEVVARAYKTALQEFPNVFDIVEFAVYCPPSGSRNYDVFCKQFGSTSDIASEKPVKQKLSSIFKKRPDQWGLRGDPYFWDYLMNLADDMDIISDAAELKRWIKEEYYSLAKEELTETSMGYVEELAHGGMSSGHVSGEWWIGTGIPLLLSRITEDKG